MSAPVNAYQSWYSQLGVAIPSIWGGPNGQADGKSAGAIVDQQLALLKAGVQACMPDFAPPDALPHIGSDQKLIQGPSESNASFIARLKDPWGQWSRAGTPCSVLEQIAYYAQSNGAVWVQQNGLQYTLSAMPTPGGDPTSLVVQTNAPTLSTILTSAVSPYRTIPSGTPWFQLGTDLNTDLCNRFAIIFPSWPFAALTTAYFTATDNVAVTWPFTFGSTSYSIQIGTPVVTDGSGGVVLHADGTTQTTAGVTIRSTAPFTGYASVVAYTAGVNPLNTWSSASAGTLQRIISTFRPTALCAGVFAIQSGRMWDYPTGSTWDGLGGQWDVPSSIATIIGSF